MAYSLFTVVINAFENRKTRVRKTKILVTISAFLITSYADYTLQYTYKINRLTTSKQLKSQIDYCLGELFVPLKCNMKT